MKTTPVYLVLFIFISILLSDRGTIAQERARIVRAPPNVSRHRTKSQPEDTVRVRTRVVFIDALVQDAKTNEPVRDLTREDFDVLDEGRSRSLSYFTRDADSRRPLALLLFIDLWTQYGRSLISNDAAMRRLASSFDKLAPEDEVAVMVTWIEEGAEYGTPTPTTKLIANFSRDRTKTLDALLSIPLLMKDQEKLMEELAHKNQREVGDLRLEIVWRLPSVAADIIALAAKFPKSQVVVVGLIDDLFDLKKGEREIAVAEALRANLIFDGMIFNKPLATRMLFGTLNKLFMSPRGLSIHAANYLAKETGGDVVSVGRADDLATGLDRFISDLSARYNLGFSLDDQEPDDGRLHTLIVRIKPRGSGGKARRLVVRARRGYYVPKTQNPIKPDIR